MPTGHVDILKRCRGRLHSYRVRNVSVYYATLVCATQNFPEIPSIDDDSSSAPALRASTEYGADAVTSNRRHSGSRTAGDNKTTRGDGFADDGEENLTKTARDNGGGLGGYFDDDDGIDFDVDDIEEVLT